MKKLLPLFLLLFCLQTAYGQKIRFTDTSNVWKELYSDGGNRPYRSFVTNYSISGYVNINGLTYRNFHWGYIREDSVNKRIYMRTQNDTIEHVLYDFSLKMGDSLVCIVQNLTIDTIVHVVSKIDSVMIFGNWHKIWTLHNVYKSTPNLSTVYFFDYNVIEGIGCPDGIIYPLYPNYFEGYRRILCFSNTNGIAIVPNPTGGYFISATTCAFSVINITHKSPTTISPNPANEHSKIIFPYTIQSGSLYISNMLGQVVIQRRIINSEQVYLGNGISAEGVYFYKVTDNQTGQSFTGKFIYQ